MPNADLYDQDFYSYLGSTSKSSALAVVPEVIRVLKPKSCLDLGCGRGEWLNIFNQHGVDVFGMDGDWVKTSDLVIPPECFQAADLSAPPALNRSFDLAISLEVAEHLPEKSADAFVAALTRSAPVILFSAAIPFQGGMGHINEQWQSYWAEKFFSQGYRANTFFRSKFWAHKECSFWYPQNMVLFVRNGTVCDPQLEPYFVEESGALNVIHPALFQRIVQEPTLEQLRLIPKFLVQKICRKLGLSSH